MNTSLYIHIPFCKKRCHYCNFCSTTKLELQEKYINRLCQELKERKEYLAPNSIKTIYFGGGTPSLLSKSNFEKIFKTLEENNYYNKEKKYEITIEVNPDDIHKKYQDIFLYLPFNRISLGVQSLQNDELQWMGRRYSSTIALQSIQYFKEYNYQNISIDLIYGLPIQSLYSLQKTLEQTIKLNIQHISTYHLNYEKNTVLYKLLKKKKIKPLEEETSIQMNKIIRNFLVNSGFKQYEISNFTIPGHASKHNISYWNGNHYLGIGVSAHSYNGKSRQFNKMLNGDIINYKPIIESINKKIGYNDFILTRLRTIKGISLIELELKYGYNKKEYCLSQAEKHIRQNLLKKSLNKLQLTKKGIIISDEIICDLLI